MGDNQSRIEVTDPETGEVFTLNAATLVSDVRHTLLSKRRVQTEATVWNKLSEQQQRKEIEDMTTLSYDIVAAIVDLVAAQGKPVIHAKLDNIQIKDGAVKTTLKGNADDQVVVALNQAGNHNLKIAVADMNRFDTARADVPVIKDAPELPMGQDEEITPDEAKTDDEAKGKTGDQAPEDPAKDIETKSDQWWGGFNSRMGGYADDKNPFDDGSDHAADWLDGWNTADGDPEAPEINADQEPDDDAIARDMDAELDRLNDMEDAAPEDEKEGDGDSETPKADTETGKGDSTTDDADSATDQGESAPETSDKEPGPYDDDEADEPSLRGQKARMREAKSDDNPFKAGSVEHVKWADGFDSAGVHITKLRGEGYEAATAGKTRRANPYEKGGPNYDIWDAGFAEGKAEAKKADAEKPDDQGNSEVDPNDNYSAGRKVGLGGGSRDANPHEPGMTKHRLWDEGWEAGNNQRLDDQGEAS